MSTFVAENRIENYLSPVRLVSNSNITGTYSNGDNGVGAALTTAVASLNIDSVAIANNDRVLLNGQTNGYENGIYVVSGVGSTIVLTRSDDFQSAQQMKPGQYCSVEAGTEFAGSLFGVVEPQVGAVGTDTPSFNNSASSPDSVTLANNGLNIYNPAGTFLNHVLFTSAITADRNFSIVTGDAARTLTFTGNATLNQDVDTTASPSFVNVQAGASGTAGRFDSFPATAAMGRLRLAAQDNAGDFTVIIQNASHGQASTYNIPDMGSASGSLLNVALATADVNINMVSFSVTVGQAALAAGGNVPLVTSSGAKQYRVMELFLNSGGTNFSGGGGDRLGQVTDGTTVYSVIPAANMQSLVNARWGDTAMAFPASAPINTLTAAGANLRFAYSGGATDYTAGSLVCSGYVERVV